MLFLYVIFLYSSAQVKRDKTYFKRLFTKSAFLKPVNSQDLYWKTTLVFLGSHSIRTAHLNGVKRTAAVRFCCLGLKPTKNMIILDEDDVHLNIQADRFNNLFTVTVISSLIAGQESAATYKAVSRQHKDMNNLGAGSNNWKSFLLDIFQRDKREDCFILPFVHPFFETEIRKTNESNPDGLIKYVLMQKENTKSGKSPAKKQKKKGNDTPHVNMGPGMHAFAGSPAQFLYWFCLNFEKFYKMAHEFQSCYQYFWGQNKPQNKLLHRSETFSSHFLKSL